MLQQRTLARYGGWVLVLFGLALVVLASVLADEQAVASIFAFTGVACVVLGVLFSRLEGPIELSATGLRAQLAALANDEGLTLEDKGDEFVAIMKGQQERPEELPSEWPTVHPYLVMDSREWDALVTSWFNENAWQVEPVGPNDPGYDLRISKKGEGRYIVEVSSRRNLSSADVRRKADRLVAAAKSQPNTGVALVVRRGGLSQTALEEVSRYEGLRVFELGPDDFKK